MDSDWISIRLIQNYVLGDKEPIAAPCRMSFVAFLQYILCIICICICIHNIDI